VTTYGQLIDSTLLQMSGYSTSQDQATYLTAQALSTDLTLAISDTTQFARGLVEIDDELLFALSVSVSSGVVVLAPWGRGYKGTTAATHTANSKVTFAPMVPRSAVKTAINEAILGVYPKLSSIKTYEFATTSGVNTYSVPALANKILSVTYNPNNQTKEWNPMRRYRIEADADATTFTTGASLTLLDSLGSGLTVRVVYASPPLPLVAETDDFVTTTGLGASVVDCIRAGATFRLINYLDLPHVFGNSAEADFGGQNRPIGSGISLAKYVYQMYKDRLEDEALNQSRLHSIRSHYTD